MSTYTCTVNTSDFTNEFLDSCGEDSGIDRECDTAELKLDIQFIEDDIYQGFLKSLNLSPGEYNGQNGDMIVVGKKMVDSEIVDLFKDPSMEFTLGTASGDQTKTIRTTFVDTYPLDPPPAEQSEVLDYVLMVVAPYQMKPQFDPLSAPTKMAFTFWSDKPGQSTAKMQTMIDSAGITASYTLYNLHRICLLYTSRPGG